MPPKEKDKVFMQNHKRLQNEINNDVCEHLSYYEGKTFQNIIGVNSTDPVIVSSAVEVIFVDITGGSVILQLPAPEDNILQAPIKKICNNYSYPPKTRPIRIEVVGDCDNTLTLQTITPSISIIENGGAVSLVDTYSMSGSGACTLYSNGDTWKLNNLFTNCTNITYNEFVELLNNSALVPFTRYAFQITTAWLSQWDVTIQEGNPEWIAIMALTPNRYNPEGLSLDYIGDTVYWRDTPSQTFDSEDAFASFNGGVFTDNGGTYTVDSIIGDTITITGNTPTGLDYVEFTAYDGSEDWSFAGQAGSISSSEIVITDIGGGQFTMQITGLSTLGTPFIPTVGNFDIEIMFSYVTYSSTGQIYARKTKNNLKTDWDFRAITDRVYNTTITYAGLTIATGYITNNPNIQTWLASTSGLAQNVVITPNTSDYIVRPTILADDSSDSSVISSANPFSAPGGFPMLNQVYDSDMKDCHSAVVTGIVNNSILNQYKSFTLLGSMNLCELEGSGLNNLHNGNVSFYKQIQGASAVSGYTRTVNGWLATNSYLNFGADNSIQGLQQKTFLRLCYAPNLIANVTLDCGTLNNKVLPAMSNKIVNIIDSSGTRGELISTAGVFSYNPIIL